MPDTPDLPPPRTSTEDVAAAPAADLQAPVHSALGAGALVLYPLAYGGRDQFDAVCAQVGTAELARWHAERCSHGGAEAGGVLALTPGIPRAHVVAGLRALADGIERGYLPGADVSGAWQWLRDYTRASPVWAPLPGELPPP